MEIFHRNAREKNIDNINLNTPCINAELLIYSSESKIEFTDPYLSGLTKIM